MEEINKSEFRFDGYLIKHSSIDILKEVNDGMELGISIKIGRASCRERV